VAIDASIARAPGGTEIVRFVAHPDGAKTIELFRLAIQDPAGTELGSLDVIRTSAAGTSSPKCCGSSRSGRTGRPRSRSRFSVPRVTVSRPLTEPERDAIVAACVDIAIGLRPYVKEMR